MSYILLRMHYLSIVVALLVAVSARSTVMCQANLDCDNITTSDLVNLIPEVIDNEGSPTVDVVRLHPVCLAHSRQQGRYRYESVVVEYTCNGSSNCPTQSANDTAVEQFEFQCSSGVWSTTVAGNTDNTRTRNPRANFSTTTRNNCIFCFSRELVLAAYLPYSTDSTTHCVGK